MSEFKLCSVMREKDESKILSARIVSITLFHVFVSKQSIFCKVLSKKDVNDKLTEALCIRVVWGFHLD